MPKLVSDKAYLPFTKGLITEVSPLAYPEGATLDEDNIIITRAGGRERRLGLKVDSDSIWVQPIASYGTCTEPTGNCNGTLVVPEDIGCLLGSVSCTDGFNFTFDTDINDTCNNVTVIQTGAVVIGGTGIRNACASFDGNDYLTLDTEYTAASTVDWSFQFAYKHTGYTGFGDGSLSGRLTISTKVYGPSSDLNYITLVMINNWTGNVIAGCENRPTDDSAQYLKVSTNDVWHTVKIRNSVADSKTYICFDGVEEQLDDVRYNLKLKYIGCTDLAAYPYNGSIDEMSCQIL